MNSVASWWQGTWGSKPRRFIYLRSAQVWRVEWIQDDGGKHTRDFYREDAAREFIAMLKSKAPGAEWRGGEGL